MRAVLLIASLLLIATAARSDGIGALDNGHGVFGRLGSFGLGKVTPPPPLTNLRITNDGSFRITNTGDNRAVFP